ncbi:Hypothetical predicted protein [Paramuricea clavata]|uniref:Uncharacterized protein n=1 Tax=Paramuricea clavata TaxID=317549 RepID=A0A7D9HAW5_PARCT|nr:Hypothetical predicted protein [Paramuricea clavata]
MEGKSTCILFFLLACCESNRKIAAASWFGSVAIAGSILLKQRNPAMSATCIIMGILLKTRSIEATMSRYNKLRFTCSNKHVGEHHDHELQKTKETITSENATLQKCDDQIDKHANHNNCNAGCMDRLKKVIEKAKNDAQKSAHAGFTIAFDILDVPVHLKNMTMSAQNDDFHWVNHRMIVNRVSGYQPIERKPRPSLNEVPNIKFMPTLQEQERQCLNYIILTCRGIF